MAFLIRDEQDTWGLPLWAALPGPPQKREGGRGPPRGWRRLRARHGGSSQSQATFWKDKEARGGAGSGPRLPGGVSLLRGGPPRPVLLVGSQYLCDDAGVLQGGGVPQIPSLPSDYLPQEPPHHLPGPRLGETLHHLARSAALEHSVMARAGVIGALWLSVAPKAETP